MTQDEQTISEILSLKDDKAKIAMIQLYTKQRCIAFAEWLREEGYEPRDKTGQEVWIQMGPKIGWLQPGKSIVVTTENLYTKFLNHQ